jgi:phosphopantothenoylcysteine decarboxylase/phosphopantothenate--cysteine ligase
LVGKGRLQEPEVIANQLESYILVSLIQKLKGKNILITAGPTYESIDPVRFIGNHSSGKMGIAIADLAHAAGAQVTLILGPCILPLVFDYNVVHIQSADEMYNHAKENFSSTDIAIFAAAVADYKPKTIENEKIKKKDCSLQIELIKNIDIAETFGKSKNKNQISVGFALETNAEVEHAKQKIVKKNFDIIVLNSLKDKGAGFKHDTNKINIIDKYNNLYNFELKTKNEVAFDLLNYIDKKIL